MDQDELQARKIWLPICNIISSNSEELKKLGIDTMEISPEGSRHSRHPIEIMRDLSKFVEDCNKRK